MGQGLTWVGRRGLRAHVDAGLGWCGARRPPPTPTTNSRYVSRPPSALIDLDQQKHSLAERVKAAAARMSRADQAVKTDEPVLRWGTDTGYLYA